MSDRPFSLPINTNPSGSKIIEYSTMLFSIGALADAVRKMLFGKTESPVGWTFILLVVCLPIYIIIQWRNTKKARTVISELTKQLETQSTEFSAKLATSSAELATLKKNAIHTIEPHAYLEVLRSLADRHGAGNLLLFNIELNSFVDNGQFDSLWKRLAEVPEVRSVRLALPTAKLARWRTIVTGERADFFSIEGNGDKFMACEYQEDHLHGPDRIAFALYQPVAAKDVAKDYDWAIFFPINRPFVNVRQDGICEYRHILEYNGNHPFVQQCRELWAGTYKHDLAETASLELKADKRRSTSAKLNELLKDHNCGQQQADRIRPIVSAERIVEDSDRDPSPESLANTPPLPDGRVSFKLRYDYSNGFSTVPDERIDGWCLGLSRARRDDPRPCIIWASGFGDGHQPQLAQILSRRIRDEQSGIVEVFFKKSGDIRETTCTRLLQDMENTLEYVERIPEIDRSRICMIGISLCGFLAARLAQRDQRIKSIIMIAPPFDVIEMLDNFRKHRFAPSTSYPKFDDFLKAKNNLRISNWENPENDYCNYFDHKVTTSHLLDIAVQGPAHFQRKSFIDAIAEITTSTRRVALVYGATDPIVDPARHMPYLDRALKSSQIDKDYFFMKEIPVTHFYPKPPFQSVYPIEVRDERQVIRDMTTAIRHCLGIVIKDEPTEGTVEVEPVPGTSLSISRGSTGSAA